jgi:hypothetical protein
MRWHGEYICCNAPITWPRLVFCRRDSRTNRRQSISQLQSFESRQFPILSGSAVAASGSGRGHAKAAPSAINVDFAAASLNFRAYPRILRLLGPVSAICFRRRKINCSLGASHSICAKNDGQRDRFLLDHRSKPGPLLSSYCRAACCCILPNGRVDTSVIFACRCNTATHPVGFDSTVSNSTHSLLWSVTRPITGLRCFNSAWQLVPSWSGLLVHTRPTGVLACWSTMPLEALGTSRHPPTAADQL